MVTIFASSNSLVNALDEIRFTTSMEYFLIPDPLGLRIVIGGHEIGRYYPEGYRVATYRGKVFLYDPRRIAEIMGRDVFETFHRYGLIQFYYGGCGLMDYRSGEEL